MSLLEKLGENQKNFIESLLMSPKLHYLTNTYTERIEGYWNNYGSIVSQTKISYRFIDTPLL